MTEKAAAGFTYLFGDGSDDIVVEPPPPGLVLRLVSQTNSTITLGWTPIPGAVGYRFSRQGYTNPDGSPRYSFTWSGTASQVKFAKGSSWYRVEALMLAAQDTYPP